MSVLPEPPHGREVWLLEYIGNFLISVIASVVAYYICKRLDGD
jgi:hypothetical protein